MYISSLPLSPDLDPLDFGQNFGGDASTLILGARRFVVARGWRPVVRKIAEWYFDGNELIGGWDAKVGRLPATAGQWNRAATFTRISRITRPRREREPESPVRLSGAGDQNE